MPLQEVEGDILLSDAQALAHGIAPNDHFTQGLALALRERRPSLPKDFHHYCHLNHPKPGGAWVWAGVQGRTIINLMTQEEALSHNQPPGKAKTQYVNHALKELRKIIEKKNIESIALPKLATGVGGLEWSDVRPLIEQHLGDLDIPVILYTTYVAGKKAAEKL